MKKILVLGSGPIVIGQAAEFDYSGTQACKMLKNEGYEVVLINNNPATIMTDVNFADAVYLEPLTPEFVEKIIIKEKPDAILAGMGGQSSLNLAVDLYEEGILEKYNVEMIGTSVESIKKSEDRELFKNAMEEIGEPCIESDIASTVEEAIKVANRIGYPLIIRPAYTLGGSGGGLVDDEKELLKVVERGLSYSPVNQVLVEKSIFGYKEVEYEMIRDKDGNVIAVCNMENIDPVGIHTGDSIVVAPSQTLSDKEYQMLRTASKRIVDALDIVGGCNVQLALDPYSFQYYVIEVNPRVSRSSALASKATGYPIAKVATKIALGYTLDEILNEVTKKTYACYEPALDYCVVKIPKWPFDKFEFGDRKLGTAMMATGEVMAIGNNFENALLKAVRSLEIGMYDLISPKAAKMSIEDLKVDARYADDERLFDVAELMRRGVTIDEIHDITKIDLYFLKKVLNIVEGEENLKGRDFNKLTNEELLKLKKFGFADKTIAKQMNICPNDVYERRLKNKIVPTYKMVDTCGGEFEAYSNYYYSTYDIENESIVTEKEKVLVIGSGPIRIGQGVEFDYCSVHGVMTLKKLGYEAIILNNNPETVSTDFDISDKLYFEPITEEDVLNIIDLENPKGVILQFGGQTAVKLSKFLDERNIPILGTDFENIDRAEDREKFEDVLTKLDLPRPMGKGVWNLEEGIKFANTAGYPVLVRPSYVIGGLGMEIIYNDENLKTYIDAALIKDKKNPVLVDKFMEGIELEIDALSDGSEILIPGIMEHLEKAGVHSGDSTSIYPANLSNEISDKVIDYTRKIAKELNVVGIFNIQFVLSDNELYIIEVNPRASRTVPFLSKVTGIQMIDVATKLMLGSKVADLSYGTGLFPHKDFVAVKTPIFSMEKLMGVDVIPNPEMKSTGEIMSIENTRELALYKSLISSKIKGTDKRAVLVSIAEEKKKDFKDIMLTLKELDYTFYATAGTSKYLKELGIESKITNKISDGENTPLDVLNNYLVDAVINIPSIGKDYKRDGFNIRRKAIEKKIDCFMNKEMAELYVKFLKYGQSKTDYEIFDISDFTIE
jgi:carbamoyl-phosphate synthase large subunit